MSEVSPTASDQVEDGVVQLRFADEEGHVRAINAAELADVLQGMVEFTSDLARTGMFGDGLAPVVRVRPPKEGSFVLEFIVHAMNTDPAGTTTVLMSAGGGLAGALRAGVRKLRGDKLVDSERMGENEIKLKYDHGPMDVVSEAGWELIKEMPKKTRRSIAKIQRPLSDDVDRVEIRDGSALDDTSDLLKQEPTVVADRAVYREAAAEVEEREESVRTFETEARLESIHFVPGKKWSVATTRDGTHLASMDDEDFLLQLERGEPIHKDDIFEVEIREVSVVNDERPSRTWSLVKVRRKKRGGDGNGAVAPGSPSE